MVYISSKFRKNILSGFRIMVSGHDLWRTDTQLQNYSHKRTYRQLWENNIYILLGGEGRISFISIKTVSTKGHKNELQTLSVASSVYVATIEINATYLFTFQSKLGLQRSLYLEIKETKVHFTW